jgi:hypothetical protein
MDVVLSKENHTQLIEVTTLDRKSGGAEGSAVRHSCAPPLPAHNLHQIIRRILLEISTSRSQSFTARLKSYPDTKLSFSVACEAVPFIRQSLSQSLRVSEGFKLRAGSAQLDFISRPRRVLVKAMASARISFEPG